MTTTHIHSIDEDDFQAFVDGQLAPEACRTVMTYLAANPDESERMSEYHKLSEELHKQFDEVLYEPLPKRLQGRHLSAEPLSRRADPLLVRHRHANLRFRAFAAVAVLIDRECRCRLVAEDRRHRKPARETPAISFARQAGKRAHAVRARPSLSRGIRRRSAGQPAALADRTAWRSGACPLASGHRVRAGGRTPVAGRRFRPRRSSCTRIRTIASDHPLHP